MSKKWTQKDKEMNYINLNLHSDYSLLESPSKIKNILDKICGLEMKACGIADINTISGWIQFYQACIKRDIKPILAVNFCCSKNQQDKNFKQILLIAQNTTGYYNLIKIISESNKEENLYDGKIPRLSVKEISKFLDGNIIGISGFRNSHVEENNTDQVIQIFKKIFKENFFIAIQLINENPFADKLRKLGKQYNIPCIALPDSYYIERTDQQDQLVLLCSKDHITLREGYESNNIFFQSNNFHIPTYEEMINYGHATQELENTNYVGSLIEDYDILKPPQLPTFKCPDNKNIDEYLRELCLQGLKKINKENDQTYVDRLDMELATIKKIKMSGYFLIMHDIIKYMKNNSWLTPIGRGSASGCIISFLIGITGVDPIQYHLLFERFMNVGRFSEERISPPDIDLDVPAQHRDKIIEYLKNKYGKQNVGHIISYQNTVGRNSIKMVMRAHDCLSFEEMNRITKNITDKHKITGELQEMGDDASVIKWSLKNKKADLENWCVIKDNKFEGKLAEEFKQAIKLEGNKSAMSRHPAGLIISDISLNQICPMIWNPKEKELMTGYDMQDLENVGQIKFDILGIFLMDKLMAVSSILKTGDII